MTRRTSLVPPGTPESHFRALVERAPLMTYVESYAPGGAEGYPELYASALFGEFFGVSTSEVHRDRDWWHGRIHPDDLARVVAADEEAGRTGEAFSVEYRVERAGEYVCVHDEAALVRDDQGQPLFWFGVVQDITALRAAKVEAEASEERYRRLFEIGRATNERLQALVDSCPLAIMTWDREGRVLSWNPAAERIFGWTAEEAVGSFLPQVQPEAREEMLEYVERGFRGETWSDLELVRRRKDGTLIPCSISSAAIRDATGAIVAVMSILADISEHRRLEAELAQAQKMEAIGTLAGGVAHDFNNLLTAISGYASLALANNGLPAEVRGDLEEILRAAASAADLTRQLLTFGRKQVSQPRVLDLNEAVRGAEGILARLVGDDVELRIELSPALACIRADPTQIDQVLVNLAANARAAMPAGGTLTIRTAAGAANGSGGALGAGRTAVLSVADTGAGMDERTRSRVFEPFFTTRPEATGLGLAAVYAIVEQGGGHIAVESEPGRGTTFAISFPAADLEPGHEASRAARGGSLHGDETVLLVEDQTAVRGLARLVLERYGYRVLEADTPSRALAVAEENGRSIQLVVTDVVLPEMNGRELVERLRERIPRAEALYMSGYAEDAVAHEGVLDADVPFLSKPFSPGDLARAVRDLLDASAGQAPGASAAARRLR